MDFTKATDEQLKIIIEQEIGVPALLLKGAFEEIIRRRILDKKVFYWITKFFKSQTNAECKTGLPIEDLFWICYETGFEIMKNYSPTHPFAAYWYKAMMKQLIRIARKNTAQKRSGEVYSLEDTHEWAIPGHTHVEHTVLNKIYFENLMSQLTEIEREIVIKRYHGYLNQEIANMQGISKQGLNKRIRVFQKRLKGA